MERKFNITKENARINQEKSAKKHKENNERRFFLIRSGQDILTSKADVTDDDRMKAAFVGYKYGKKAAVGEKAFIDMLYQAKLDGNYKAFVELCKISGMHFDQSPEALGGVDNPINVAQKTTIAPEQVKEISSELEGDC